jgi:hypothetical protein
MLKGVAALVAAGKDDPRQLGDRQSRLEPGVERRWVAAARRRVDEREDGLALPDEIDGPRQVVGALCRLALWALGSVAG